MSKPNGVIDVVMQHITSGCTNAAQIIEASGLEKKVVWNALSRLKARGSIRSAGRGPSAVIELAGGRSLPAPVKRRAPKPKPEAEPPADFRALMTHRCEIQVHKSGAIVDLTPAEALELHAFLDSISPVLQAQAEAA